MLAPDSQYDTPAHAMPSPKDANHLVANEPTRDPAGALVVSLATMTVVFGDDDCRTPALGDLPSSCATALINGESVLAEIVFFQIGTGHPVLLISFAVPGSPAPIVAVPPPLSTVA